MKSILLASASIVAFAGAAAADGHTGVSFTGSAELGFYNEGGNTAADGTGDPYTEGLASVFRDEFAALGGEIVAFEAEAAEATNVEPLLTSIAAAGPEMIYIDKHCGHEY